MGIIRILLALSVVASHYAFPAQLQFVGGGIAVECFYIISGFYIAMILGNYQSSLLFWKSRFLRLYPTYIFCALITLLFWPAGAFISKLAHLPTPAALFLGFTNLTMFFQDVTMFLGVHGEHVYFTKDFFNSTPPLFTCLLLPQAWTLGIEISFYLIAPMLLKLRFHNLILIMTASIACKVILEQLGLSHDPWTWRFFPSELVFFLMGSVSYLLYSQFQERLHGHSLLNRLFQKKISAGLLIAVVAMIVIFNFLPMPYTNKKIILFVLLALSVGSIFQLTKNWYWDNLVGMLSFPVYCSHLFILQYVLPKVPCWANNHSFLGAFISCGVILVISLLIYLIIEVPIDRYRQRYKIHRESLPS